MSRLNIHTDPKGQQFHTVFDLVYMWRTPPPSPASIGVLGTLFSLWEQLVYSVTFLSFYYYLINTVHIQILGLISFSKTTDWPLNVIDILQHLSAFLMPQTGLAERSRTFLSATCSTCHERWSTCQQQLPLPHSCIHSFNHSFNYSFIHPFIHPFLHSSIHPFIHSNHDVGSWAKLPKTDHLSSSIPSWSSPCQLRAQPPPCARASLFLLSEIPTETFAVDGWKKKITSKQKSLVFFHPARLIRPHRVSLCLRCRQSSGSFVFGSH